MQKHEELAKIIGALPAMAQPPVISLLGSAVAVEKNAFERGQAEGSYRAQAELLQARTDITPRQKRQLGKKLLEEVRQKRGALHRKQAELDQQLSNLTNRIAALTELSHWGEECHPGKLESFGASALHHLMDAFNSNKLLFMEEGAKEEVHRHFMTETLSEIHSFVICHDWAAAFEKAQDFDGGDAPFPYDHCCYEFKVSGRKMLILTNEGTYALCAETLTGWLVMGDRPECESLSTGLLEQIRAVNIALDAEVAVEEVVRAPHKLNRAREKAGKVPVHDYHVVRLAERKRAGPSPLTGTHRSPRLHFRRGHWRHYETFKTWIRWTLVGNPDLGFIDKEYRL